MFGHGGSSTVTGSSNADRRMGSFIFPMHSIALQQRALPIAGTRSLLFHGAADIRAEQMGMQVVYKIGELGMRSAQLIASNESATAIVADENEASAALCVVERRRTLLTVVVERMRAIASSFHHAGEVVDHDGVQSDLTAAKADATDQSKIKIRTHGPWSDKDPRTANRRQATSKYWQMVKDNLVTLTSPGFGGSRSTSSISLPPPSPPVAQEESTRKLASITTEAEICSVWKSFKETYMPPTCTSGPTLPDVHSRGGIGDGFIADKNSYSSSSIWNDPILLGLRIPESHKLRRTKLLAHHCLAEVWLSRFSNKQVAVTRLHDSEQAMADTLPFAEELRNVACLKHPNLVHLVGVEWTNGLEIQAVTEFLEHGDLRSFLSTDVAKSLTWEDHKCAMAIDVADGLAYLHSLEPKVIMRDLHSRRVLLDKKNRAKINTVCMSRSRSVKNIIASKTEKETLYWLAPEILRDEPYTEMADIYSFGVLLSELDTTKPPYNVTTTNVTPNGYTVTLTLAKDRPLLPSFSAACPERISSLAHECIAHDPKLRPSASSIAYRLRSILKEL